jgi:TatD DNase family protein
MIFDTHCHGYWNGLAHRQDELRANMQSEGVERSVQIGTDLETSRKALALARQWGRDTWCSVGIHPTACQDMPPDSASKLMAQFLEFIQSNREKVVGIGETGLDYYHLTAGKEKTQKQTQHVFFRAQAELALRLDMPLIVHTRNAAADTIALLKESRAKKAVIHCYSENPGFARQLQEWSDAIYFSFSGILTYKNALPVQETARLVALTHILVETDAPFLVPQAVRDRFSLNEPSFTRHVMDCLKTLRPESGHAVEQTVWENSNRFFGLSLPPL